MKDNIVLAMSSGWERVVVEIMLLLHLITTFPIITNPPTQAFEKLLHIPPHFNWKRCAFRSFSVLSLLFIAESVPSFGAILDLVGASTVTLLTFVFPPYFYIKLVDASSLNPLWEQREVFNLAYFPNDVYLIRVLPLWERIYCWLLILVGVTGGVCSTTTAVIKIITSQLSRPCYLMTEDDITLETGSAVH